MQQQLTRDDAAASTTNENATTATEDETAAPSIEGETATAEADAALPVFPYEESEVASASLAPNAPGSEPCPDCGGDTINGQGALDCRDCDWVGLP